MNNSAEKDNPEVFPENKTGGIHCYKSLISPSNKKKKKNTTHQKTKQKLAITKNACIVRSSRLRGLFLIASRRNLCKKKIRQRKVWIIASKFEITGRQKCDADRILSSFVFVDCLLKVFSIMRPWMVHTILNLSATFRKLK